MAASQSGPDLPQPGCIARCACGQRVRIAAPRPGARYGCPKCKRPLRIPAAAPQVPPAPSRPASVAAPAAGAPNGPAAAAPADGDLFLDLAVGPAVAVDGPPPVAAAAPDVPMEDGTTTTTRPVHFTASRSFLHDLATAFVLNGRPQNVIGVLAMGLACGVPSILRSVPFLSCLIWPLLVVVYVIVLLYVIQFLWHTLTSTAGGEDEIPLIQPDFSWWDDAVMPAIWLMAISGLCFGPALYFRFFAETRESLLVLGLMIAGSFFWPVAVMSVALGDSLLFVRPDWLLRCIFGIGPVYIVAWLTLVASLFVSVWMQVAAIPHNLLAFILIYPLASWIIRIYFGYVMFRILGLLFRHFRERFPWNF